MREAQTLKELYPGGVEQARGVAERARTLDEIDAAFYGGAGKSPGEQTAGRAALAQRMLREDPAAFREMVFAGLRALEESGSAPATRPEDITAPLPVGARHAVPAPTAAEHPQLGEYRAFEKSANEDLERSVGGAINRALSQALPDVQRGGNASTDRARHAVPLQERLGGAIRADVETALKGDSQLGEQIAQLLSARRFDDKTRAQVVRLINDRAQQLVPVAARRVIQDWTQTAFAAHRSRNEAAAATNGASVPGSNGGASRPASSFGPSANARPASPPVSAKAAAADRAESAVGLATRATSRVSGRLVDYRKLSDEQILEL